MFLRARVGSHPFEAVGEEQEQLRPVRFADVLEPFREAVVDLVTSDAVNISGGIAGHEALAPPPVGSPPKPCNLSCTM